jgi:hypothetical protein
MPDNNKLELVIEVDVNKANASIKSINTDLSSMEKAASRAARGASARNDGLTVSVVKGATAGNLVADAIKHGVEWLTECTVYHRRSEVGGCEHRPHGGGHAVVRQGPR